MPTSAQSCIVKDSCMMHQNKHPYWVDETHTLSLWMQEAKLEAYEAMPIASFGEAMLRGMGWKEGMSVGRNVPKEVSKLHLRAICIAVPKAWQM